MASWRRFVYLISFVHFRKTQCSQEDFVKLYFLSTYFMDLTFCKEGSVSYWSNSVAMQMPCWCEKWIMNNDKASRSASKCPLIMLDRHQTKSLFSSDMTAWLWCNLIENKVSTAIAYVMRYVCTDEMRPAGYIKATQENIRSVSSRPPTWQHSMATGFKSVMRSFFTNTNCETSGNLVYWSVQERRNKRNSIFL